MASYNLYLGKPKGEQIFSKKNRKCIPDASLGVDSWDVLQLGLDHEPYQNTFWAGENLKSKKAALEKILQEKQEKAIEAVKHQLHLQSLDSWAMPMIEEHMSKDKSVAMLQGLLGLVETAVLNGGMVVYWCD